MSRLNDLLRELRTREPSLAHDLEREVSALADRRAFGLNFERHVPEAVELPGRPIRKGDKVRILSPRGESPKKTNETLWRVVGIDRTKAKATLEELAPAPSATGMSDAQRGLFRLNTTTASLDDLVVVAEFRDPIYPGLVSTGKVERGGYKPYHVVINAENYHALETLLFTHRGKVDAIYIDPPYNTRDKDWKYNNDYVNSDDLYKHSKWLAMMERRLVVAKELLKPADSVLIVTIDEKEYLRLGLLLEQLFPESTIQMVSSQTNPKGVSRGGSFRRSDEYLFFVMFGVSRPIRMPLSSEWSTSTQADSSEPQDDAEDGVTPEWTSMMRRGSEAHRSDRPSMFYPIYADPSSKKIVEIGEPLPDGEHVAPHRDGLVAILPIRRDGSEGRWQIGASELGARIKQGRIRLGRPTSYGFVVNYLPDGAYADVMSDKFEIKGYAPDGSLIAVGAAGDLSRIAPTQWKIASHNASENGSTLLASFLPKRKFPFPKSLYAVEDALRFFIKEKPEAVILDYFSGSGTTAHSVMRLNRQDDGMRQCISITNNEVAADEQSELRKRGLRPGDTEWEKNGICDFITKPRVQAAITGKTPDGDPIKGEYKFTDEFPMAEGFEENAEFFTLTYEAPLRVAGNREFTKIAPLLWIRAGSKGRRIDSVSKGWDVADVYGVLTDLDHTGKFIKAVSANENMRVAFIVTDDDRLFESVSQELPEHVEPVRLYEAYLRNFEIDTGRDVL